MGNRLSCCVDSSPRPERKVIDNDERPPYPFEEYNEPSLTNLQHISEREPEGIILLATCTRVS